MRDLANLLIFNIMVKHKRGPHATKPMSFNILIGSDSKYEKYINHASTVYVDFLVTEFLEPCFLKREKEECPS